MEYYKYTSRGLSLSGKAGKVSYLHSSCHATMTCTTAGPSGQKMEGSPPDVDCIWCGKPLGSQA